VPITRRLVAPVAALILTLSPAAALAQSAGDQQYADPFGNNEQNQSGGGGPSGGGGGSGGAGSSGSGGGQSEAAPAASDTTSQSGGSQLPLIGLVAALAVLLLAGLARWASRRRRAAPGR
jgi:cobalamin biosynthesis Mg chelatase CobN